MTTTPTVTRKKITKRYTVKNTPEQLVDLARVAESPLSTKEELTKAWKATKSTAIRKKIASNGNADTDILKMSARLYLKEVLHNPSFELTELFIEDPFVKALSTAYKDPTGFIHKGGHYAFRHADAQILLRACLLSPKLTYPTLFGSLLGNIPPDSFRRELQDREVFDRIKKLIGKEFDVSVNVRKWGLRELHKLGRRNNYYVDHFFTLYKAGIVPESNLYNLLYKVGANSSCNYSSNTTAIKLIIKNLEMGEVERAAKLMLCGNSYTLTAVCKKMSSDDKDIKPLLTNLVKCFEVVLDMTCEVGWDEAMRGGEAHFLGSMFSNITDTIIRICLNTTKKKDMVNLEREDFINVYNMYKEVGFLEYASVYKQEKVCICDPHSLYALDSCPREVIEFFIFSNFLKPKINLSTSLSNILKILEDINNSGGVEDMVYNQSALDYIKRVRFDDDKMRVKGLIHYGYDLRKYPVYCSRYYYGSTHVPDDLMRMFNRGRTKPVIPYVSSNPITQRILNMTQ